MKQYTLDQIWDQQLEYNLLVMSKQERTSSEWMINYLLGTMSELTELLEQTNWKKHRVASTSEFGPNVQEELADITKYVFSMWQVMGLTPLDMLNSMNEKGEILKQLMYQETRQPLVHRYVLMLDLDGVIADFRYGFIEWVQRTKWRETLTIKEEDIGLHMDINNGWDYTTYNQAKLEFEKSGGYGKLPVIKTIKHAVNTLHRVGWYIIVHTARPHSMFKRIWSDTWNWLKFHDIEVDELYFGYDERITMAQELAHYNKVTALEDDPTLVKRYAGCNIPVFVYPQPYNIQTVHESNIIYMLDTDSQDWEISDAIFNIKQGRIHNGQR